MTFELIIVFFIIRYLRKSLGGDAMPLHWVKLYKMAMALTIGLFVIEVAFAPSRPILTWLINACVLGLFYEVYKIREFQVAKYIVNAVLPLILLEVVSDLIKLINRDFYYEWKNFFELAELFAAIWMFAMWWISRKQKKALDLEHQKREEIEKASVITAKLKAELEVQVAERTAALRQQKEELEQTLEELKSTQSQLIQSEKMASLGELTAGIAHEIQNPLNFINNFSEINTELIAEMKQEIESGNLEEAKAIAGDIAANEEKINHHGKRADGIVKGMLQHSRNSGGSKEPTDINALADEYLRLAYHGLRAKDKSFNATLKTNYDTSIDKINIFPQDIGRVILNLITNAFYVVAEKKRTIQQLKTKQDHSAAIETEAYEPMVAVSTKKLGGKIEIKVTDNGNGISPTVLEKIFQPFFTTKPTGQGTGLGLSLSYDIVKAHGGEITVQTEENKGTSFTVILPV